MAVRHTGTAGAGSLRHTAGEAGPTAGGDHILAGGLRSQAGDNHIQSELGSRREEVHSIQKLGEELHTMRARGRTGQREGQGEEQAGLAEEHIQ